MTDVDESDVMVAARDWTPEQGDDFCVGDELRIRRVSLAVPEKVTKEVMGWQNSDEILAKKCVEEWNLSYPNHRPVRLDIMYDGNRRPHHVVVYYLVDNYQTLLGGLR